MLATEAKIDQHLSNAIANLRKANIQSMISHIHQGNYQEIITKLKRFNFKYTDEERIYFLTEAASMMNAENCEELGAILELITVKCMM